MSKRISRHAPTLLVFLVAVVFGTIGFLFALKQEQSTAQQHVSIEGIFWPDPRLFDGLYGVDHTGSEFGTDNLRGKWSFVFFGYTHCPDICPQTLALIKQIYPRLVGLDSKPLQVIFVSVDPQRDNYEKLGQYVDYFHEDFVGLSVEMPQLTALRNKFGISFFAVPPKNPGDRHYLIDHSASIFLLDHRARLVGKLSAPHTPDDILRKYQEITRFINAQG